jgi:hypothetical protein
VCCGQMRLLHLLQDPQRSICGHCNTLCPGIAVLNTKRRGLSFYGIATLCFTVQVRVFQNNRCALSGNPLELPAVHFLCGHSFNARSLGENERECPLCAPQFRTILEIRRSLRAGAAEQVCAAFARSS